MELAVVEQIPEAPETYTRASTALVAAQHWQIADNADFLKAGEFRDGLKAIEVEINETFDKPIADAFRAHKSIVAAKKKYSEPLEEALRLIKQKMIGWTQSQEQIRRLEQARLEAEAKRKAEEEALELAQTLAAAGATEAAEQVLEEPIAPTPVILPRATPKIQGFSSRRIYDAEITDQFAFAKGVVNGLIPVQAIGKGDEQFLRKQAGALKEAMKWPGVKVTWRDV